MVYRIGHIIALTKNINLFESLKATFNGDQDLEYASDMDTFFSLLKLKRHEVVFLDLDLLGLDASPSPSETLSGLFKTIKDESPSLLTVIVTPVDKKKWAIEAMRAGASSYLTYPIKPVEVKYTLEKLYKTVQAQGELEYLRDSFWQKDFQDVLRTKSPLMRSVYEQIKAVAPARATVLVTGEPGTGKTLLAKLIHQHSGRANKPFISVHCGAIPEGLVESELFGHEKGAFTGAIRKKLGKFEIAHGGTIFLDEIGTVSSSVQVKLLQI